jgi:hypothetical protein
VLGFGPEAWDGTQRLYAHNTFVSYLYEFGVVGLVFLLLFFATQTAIAAQAVPLALAARLVAAFGGFIIANLATMPLWLIEGLILLALLCALSWSSADERYRLDARSPSRRPIGARWAEPTPATGAPRLSGAVGAGRGGGRAHPTGL